MSEFKVQKRKIIEGKTELTELVFNHTDCNYFSLVSKDEVNQYNMPNLTCNLGGYVCPLEVRTVRGYYRNGNYYFTLVRLDPYYTVGWSTTSFGRQIAPDISEYFHDMICRRTDLQVSWDKLFSFERLNDGRERNF